MLPLQCLRCCLENSQLNLAPIVVPADDKANLFPFFQRISTLEDEALVLCFNEARRPGMQERRAPMPRPTVCLRASSSGSAFLVERAVLRDDENNVRRVIRIEVCEVRELVGEFVPQSRVEKDFPVTVAFAPLHERGDE